MVLCSRKPPAELAEGALVQVRPSLPLSNKRWASDARPSRAPIVTATFLAAASGIASL